MLPHLHLASMSDAQNSPSYRGFPPSNDVYSRPNQLNATVFFPVIGVFLLLSGFIVLLYVCASRRSEYSYGFLIVRRRTTHSVSVSPAPQPQHNTGLDGAAVAMIPTLIYKSGCTDGLHTEGGVFECAVCLGEFRDNQKLRSLPFCKHIFHMDCIDKWFVAHSTCPICRTPVVSTSLRSNTEAKLQEIHICIETPQRTGSTHEAASSSTEFPFIVCNQSAAPGEPSQMVALEFPSPQANAVVFMVNTTPSFMRSHMARAARLPQPLRSASIRFPALPLESLRGTQTNRSIIGDMSEVSSSSTTNA
ncbi:hypothetical protein KP509_22G061200 [Ceratopteris richardii]|uniref:RING-type E3 ubiquitin transferase n=1 Tax=Ceratopteris richardii TaxID=49495 RepID=A0A8T2S8L5_CERRI|nr:hypothetical protein KP509_22G061200 [Ceratopteris richardii]